MKLIRASLCAVALVATLTPLAAQDLSTGPRRPVLTVSGEGKASAAPDMATLSSGVVSEGKTAREALDANSSAVAQMIAAIKAAGVEGRDVFTSGFSVQPQYAPPKKDSSEAPRITGYQVSNNVTVRVRDLAKLGSLLDELVTKGANQIGGIAFDISEPGKLTDAARAAAVKDARHQAEIIAEASGVRIVRVVSISGEGGPRPMPRMMSAPAMMMKEDSVPVEAGETEVRAGVSITYEIEPR
ncbi:SIMPL domain-containing protein [Starkeya sp. 3C]|uniref:SIMPL domain-containing protein n=1 Tax=Ancylobacter moscoviensis TaxID=2597768 RepID=A0ABY3DS52_9HYPH|nr:SIMPL domain-containing protein [Ancylobacter moscoviensis]TSJ62831.1 SIMPL domain-containing protein [Ancylobacter moscoviensis]